MKRTYNINLLIATFLSSQKNYITWPNNLQDSHLITKQNLYKFVILYVSSCVLCTGMSFVLEEENQYNILYNTVLLAHNAFHAHTASCIGITHIGLLWFTFSHHQASVNSESPCGQRIQENYYGQDQQTYTYRSARYCNYPINFQWTQTHFHGHQG